MAEEAAKVKKIRISQEQFDLAVTLLVAGVELSKIAEAVSLAEEAFALLQENEKFKTEVEKKRAEKFKNQVDTDNGWDDLERKAVQGLNAVMKYNKDPDMLLRIAAVSNKAIRPTSNRNQPIALPSDGGRVVLNLNAQFVNNIQEKGVTASREIRTQAKITNQYPQHKLESMLDAVSDEKALPVEEEFDQDLLLVGSQV